MLNRLFLVIFILSSSLGAFTLYEDKNSNVSIDKVFNNEYEFNTPKQISYNYTDSTFWLKFDFLNNEETSLEKYILFNLAVLNYVDVYYKSNSQLIVSSIGAGGKKEFPFNEVAFSVPLDKIDNKTLYVKVKHKGVLSLENKIFDSKEELFTLLKLRNDTTMLMIGTIALIIFFIAIIAYSLKEVTYRLYLFFLFFLLLMQLAINNSLTWLVGVNNIDFIVHVGGDLAAISAYLFMMNVTQMKDKLPNVYRFFKLITTLTLYVLITEFIQYNEIHSIKNSIVIPSFLVIVFSSLIYMFYKKAKYSKFLFFGWMFLFAASITLYLSVNGMITSMYNPIIWKFFIMMGMITFSLLLLYRIKELAEQNVQHELVLEEQSKLAVIGETLTNIEHQWRSPLSKISSNIIALETELEIKGKVENRSLKKSLLSMNDTLEYMTNLVDHFKVFYMKDQEKKPFLVENSYLRVIRLLEYDFLKYNIKVEYIDEGKAQIVGHLNEFTQVILNILSNSRDIFIQRKIKEPKIKINIFKKNNHIIITIEDNAGGIEDSSVEQVFNQFFSDKDKQGTGVGLYLCKHIVEKKMNGTISVKNKNLGAKFTIKL